jgi:AcrR family transcriptional regulator
MRYSGDHKEKTHERIVREAGRLFREHGYKGTGVDAVMKAAGLTQGGFYAHFRDKDELLAETLVQSSEDVAKFLPSAGPTSPKAFAVWVDRYLSEEHRDHPEAGCPLPTLGGEVPRQPKAVREAFNQSLDDYIAAVARILPEGSDAARKDVAIAVLASLAGGMLLARAVEDPTLSARVLRVVRSAVKTQTAARPTTRPRSKSPKRKK